MDLMQIATAVVLDVFPNAVEVKPPCVCHLNDAGSGHFSGCINA